MNERKARGLVYARSAIDGENRQCEVRILDVCLGRGMNFQHRKNKSQGGLWLPSNGIDVCGSGTTGCHGWIHANPTAAVEKGWTVPSWADPAEVPVLLHTLHYGHDWVLLDEDGCYALAPFPEGKPGHPDDLAWGGAA